MNTDYLEEKLKEIEEAQGRLNTLREEYDKLLVEYYNNLPSHYDFQKYTDENKHRCSVCGLEFSGVMGYVCSRYQCPSGFGGAWC